MYSIQFYCVGISGLFWSAEAMGSKAVLGKRRFGIPEAFFYLRIGGDASSIALIFDYRSSG